MKKYSGPAFPTQRLDEDEAYEPGMSLRDYFAGQALVMAGVYMVEDNNTEDMLADVIAKRAYKLADAMLKARDA